MKSFLDRHVNRFVSKKLLVWTVATVFLVIGIIPVDPWMILTSTYLGSQAAVDIVKKLKG